MEHINNHQRQPQKITMCNWSDLEIIGYRPIMPKNSPRLKHHKVAPFVMAYTSMNKPFCYMKSGLVKFLFEIRYAHNFF